MELQEGSAIAQKVSFGIFITLQLNTFEPLHIHQIWFIVFNRSGSVGVNPCLSMSCKVGYVNIRYVKVVTEFRIASHKHKKLVNIAKIFVILNTVKYAT